MTRHSLATWSTKPQWTIDWPDCVGYYWRHWDGDMWLVELRRRKDVAKYMPGDPDDLMMRDGPLTCSRTQWRHILEFKCSCDSYNMHVRWSPIDNLPPYTAS